MNYQLKIISGIKAHEIIDIPSCGLVLGRGSSASIDLQDEALSHAHCRVYLTDGLLYILDMNSTNGTFVNDTEITTETQLKSGDKVLIGETTLTILAPNTQRTPEAIPPPKSISPSDPPRGDQMSDTQTSKPLEQPPPPVSPSPLTTPEEPIIDLGLTPAPTTPMSQANTHKRILHSIIFSLSALIVLGVGAMLFLNNTSPEPTYAIKTLVEPDTDRLEIFYEKIEISPTGIFRYRLNLDSEKMLALSIDDIGTNNRTLSKTPKLLTDDTITALRNKLLDLKFTQLERDYSERVTQPDHLRVATLQIVSGRHVILSRLENATNAKRFEAIADTLEAFSKNELGTWAIDISADDLRREAKETFDIANRYYEQRKNKEDALWNAIANYKKALDDIDTLNPKPDFAPALTTALTTAQLELTERHDAAKFAATRAVNIQDFAEAEQQLTLIIKMIPDRQDPRNIDAAKQLLSIQSKTRKNLR